MYAIDQSKLRASKIFSSLRSLQKVFSSNSLVKISTSWFSVLIWYTSCWDHASSPKVLQEETTSAEAVCT
jgi:hypothetical protein